MFRLVLLFDAQSQVWQLVDLEVGVVVGFLSTNITGLLVWVQFDFRFGCDITVVFSVLTFGCKCFSTNATVFKNILVLARASKSSFRWSASSTS